MKASLAALAAVPLLGAGLIGVGTASAHGFMLEPGEPNVTPEQIATKQQTMFQQQADILGVSIDDVKNAWAKGQTMEELAKEKGVTQEQIQAKMKDLRTTHLKTELKALVDKGIITQAQADARLQFMQTRLDNVSAKGFMMGKMRGFRHGNARLPAGTSSTNSQSAASS